MTRASSAGPRMRIVRAASAMALALATLLVPVDAPTVRAADDGLLLTTNSTYRLVPSEGRIGVTVDLTATNTTPNTTSRDVVTRYYFDRVTMVIQPEASNVSATSGGRRLAVTVRSQKRLDLVEVRFADAIYYGQAATIRLHYDLPSGKPRSTSNVRVGVAFSTFVAWAFGDSARVRIEVPAAFVVDSSGATLQRQKDKSTIVLSSGPISDPLDWYAVIDATRDRALTSKRLSPAAGQSVLVRGWPEDKAWVGRVSDVLAKGLPVLDELVGLPWPVPDELEIVEIHTALLEGYAGSTTRRLTRSVSARISTATPSFTRRRTPGSTTACSATAGSARVWPTSTRRWPFGRSGRAPWSLDRSSVATRPPSPSRTGGIRSRSRTTRWRPTRRTAMKPRGG